MAKMTKSQFVQALAELMSLTKKDASEKWDAFVAMAYKEVKVGGEFSLPGLGKLVKKDRAARTGRNPLTGAEIQIPAKTVVKFRVAKQCKDSIL